MSILTSKKCSAYEVKLNFRTQNAKQIRQNRSY